MGRFLGIVIVLAAGLGCATAWAQVKTGKSPEKIIRLLDSDGNGQVDRGEWRKSMHIFDDIDSDGSGGLTLEELRVHMGVNPKPELKAEEGRSASVEWFDVHVHPSLARGKNADAKGTVDAALAAMDVNHISLMVLMPQPMISIRKTNGKVFRPVPFERWIDEALQYPDRFAVMGGGGSLNAMIHEDSPDGRPSDDLKRRFAARAEAILERGAVGFGEIAVNHLSMVPGQPVMIVPADHPLLLMLADIAAKHDAVIDVHFDLVLEDMPCPDYVTDANPALLRRNIDAFERFLAHNRRAKISWAHAGSDRLSFWTAEFTREMLDRHPNLFMSLRMFPSKSGLNHPLTDDGITNDWMRTFKRFPDRFFLGGDQFFLSPAMRDAKGPGATFARMSQNTRERTNRFLGYLPTEIARKFAYENAMRVYKISGTGGLARRN